MLGVGLFAGAIIRTWDLVAHGSHHVLRLHHHTVSGNRHLVLDDAEVYGSRGSTNVVSLTKAGDILRFQLPSSHLDANPATHSTAGATGFVKILPHGGAGFSYHCFLNDNRVPERGEALSSKKLAEPFVSVSLPATEVHPDATGALVTFYRMDVMSDTRGTSCIKRFSEFFELHNLLKAAYKGSPMLGMLPAFPQRSVKLVANHSGAAFIAQRRARLQRYMSGLSRLDIMRTNRDFLTFIGLSSPDGVLRDRSEVVVEFGVGPMGMTLKPTNRVNEPAEIVGFKPLPGGQLGPAQACGKLHVGDILNAVNGTSVAAMSYTQAIAYIKTQPRPLRLHFLTMAIADGGSDIEEHKVPAAASEDHKVARPGTQCPQEAVPGSPSPASPPRKASSTTGGQLAKPAAPAAPMSPTRYVPTNPQSPSPGRYRLDPPATTAASDKASAPLPLTPLRSSGAGEASPFGAAEDR